MLADTHPELLLPYSTKFVMQYQNTNTRQPSV